MRPASANHMPDMRSSLLLGVTKKCKQPRFCIRYLLYVCLYVWQDSHSLLDLPLKKVMKNGLDYLQIASFCSTQNSSSDEVFESSATNFIRSALAVYFPPSPKGLPPVCSTESIQWLLIEVNRPEVSASSGEAEELSGKKSRCSIKDYVPTNCGLLDECVLRILTYDLGSPDERTGFERKVFISTFEQLLGQSFCFWVHRFAG